MPGEAWGPAERETKSSPDVLAAGRYSYPFVPAYSMEVSDQTATPRSLFCSPFKCLKEVLT